MKVFSGHAFVKGQQYHATVAASSQKEAAQITGLTSRYFRSYWCETGNEGQIAAATAQPKTLLIEIHPYSGEWIPASNPITTDAARDAAGKAKAKKGAE